MTSKEAEQKQSEMDTRTHDPSETMISERDIFFSCDCFFLLHTLGIYDGAQRSFLLFGAQRARQRLMFHMIMWTDEKIFF